MIGVGDYVAVQVWEVGTGRPVATLKRHAGVVLGVTFVPAGGTLASAGGDGTVKRWRPPE